MACEICGLVDLNGDIHTQPRRDSSTQVSSFFKLAVAPTAMSMTARSCAAATGWNAFRPVRHGKMPGTKALSVKVMTSEMIGVMSPSDNEIASVRRSVTRIVGAEITIVGTLVGAGQVLAGASAKENG